ncbi:PepSY-like domain-containing protein [Pontibacter silvestris]|nr:PepSY-like domain-containing protein [Pontibacter silvestris]MCC9137145.1 PepSY-like domain-containing protein [Pontibacter silvestris]
MRLLFILSFFMFSCNDDDNDVAPNSVPEAVTNALATAFPDATDVEWEMSGENYEADFDVNTVDYKALLTADGSMLMYKHDIAQANLPEAVRTSISQNYNSLQVDDTELLSLSGTTYYQIDFDQEGQDTKVVFTEDGQVQEQLTYWD